MKKLIAGNWKMNLNSKQVKTLVDSLLIKNLETDNAQYLICPPALYLAGVAAQCADTHIQVGAQDCAAHDNGAHTGDISAAMIADCGASHVILGHSERRHNHNEDNDLIRKKSEKAYAAGLEAIICVGETAAQRDNGQEQDIVKSQLMASLAESCTSQNTIIAYEPVWAIGTGKTANVGDVADMHGFIRDVIAARFSDAQNVRILYGGSMKPENAAALLATPNVDGGLIGGASLKADSFADIGAAART